MFSQEAMDIMSAVSMVLFPVAWWFALMTFGYYQGMGEKQ